MQPLFYFPSTVIGIDDNQQSLSALKNILQSKHKLITFDDSTIAANFLHSYQSPLSKLHFFSQFEDESLDLNEHHKIDFNLSKLLQLSQNDDKNNEISVLILDQSMPGINGLDLCRSLKGSPIKIILLTGESNDHEAVKAFNEKIIDNFFRKDSPTLANDLRGSVERLMFQYFFEQTRSLLLYLETKRKLPLSDKKFTAFFETWLKNHDIKEYYLIDKIGSFLCINSKAEVHHFIVHTDHSISSFIELYEEAQFPIPECIQSRQKIPFFGINKFFWQEDIKTWENHCYPANLLEGREKYWWAVV